MSTDEHVGLSRGDLEEVRDAAALRELRARLESGRIARGSARPNSPTSRGWVAPRSAEHSARGAGPLGGHGRGVGPCPAPGHGCSPGTAEMACGRGSTPRRHGSAGHNDPPVGPPRSGGALRRRGAHHVLRFQRLTGGSRRGRAGRLRRTYAALARTSISPRSSSRVRGPQRHGRTGGAFLDGQDAPAGRRFSR